MLCTFEKNDTYNWPQSIQVKLLVFDVISGMHYSYLLKRSIVAQLIRHSFQFIFFFPNETKFVGKKKKSGLNKSVP